jgi:hypothetical protein
MIWSTLAGILGPVIERLIGPVTRLLGYAATFATGWLARGREQRHAQDIANAEGKITRATAELDAARAGRDANLQWMRENRPKSVQPIRLDRDPGAGRGDRER